MDGTVFRCPGCGEPVDIDFKTRKGHCDFCGNVVTFPRSAFNNNEKVKNELKYCMRCFEEKRYVDAKEHAENILATAYDNAPALYARTYYEAFSAVNKNSARVGEFFSTIEDLALENEEVELLVKMFLSTVYRLKDNEEDVLHFATSYLSGAELCSFVDAFSPMLIVKRDSIDFFTPALSELYAEIAGQCSIPKTCYALLQAIMQNPDSPYPESRFFLKTKTQRFYNDFVLPVGEIIQKMDSQELSSKFYNVYQIKTKDFLKQMYGGIN